MEHVRIPTRPLLCAVSLLCLVFCLVLAGCGGGKGGIRTHGPGVDEPYVVKGRKYYPLQSAVGFRQEGMASWYGPGFHGKRTSSGEVFDETDFTAAHTILPFGSQIEVTNLRNGRSVVVRINDRGPFTDRRVIDLSKAAARQIDMIGTGTTRVRLRHVGEEEPHGADVAEPELSVPVEGTFYIQVGAFGDKGNAVRALKRARRLGKPGDLVQGRRLWRVVLGPWQDLNTANDNLWDVRTVFPEAIVVSD